MPTIRNPFRRAPGEPSAEVSGRSKSYDSDHSAALSTTPAHGPKPLEIRPNGNKQPTEYKMSEINDSGVYLPPSPTEKSRTRAARKHRSTGSANHRSVFSENEPFNMSRESFDSYRRSFDITARSPISEGADSQKGRPSTDSRLHRLSPSAATDSQVHQAQSQPKDGFEDLALHGEGSKPKKQGIFARFGHSASDGRPESQGASSRPGSSHFGTHMFGRKRGTSGQGSELASLPTDDSRISTAPEIRVDN